MSRADVIVSVTGSIQPLFPHHWIKPGTHITAVGADAPGKQELAIELVDKADVLVADLVSQCVDHGELSHAVGHSRVETSSIRELGDILLNPEKGRTSDQQITIADLTGVAAQDIAIAQAVLGAHALELKIATV